MPGQSGAPVEAGRVAEKTYQVLKISLQELSADGYDKVNYGGSIVNSTIALISQEYDGQVPNGLLGSMVVVTRGDNLIGPPTIPVTPGTSVPLLTERPQGVVMRDVAGMPWEGTRTDEANKVTHYQGPANVLTVSLFETRRRNQPGTPPVGQHSALAANDFTYAPGDLLYIDEYSALLTQQAPVDNAGNSPINNPNGPTPAVAFNPADTRNGVWPWEYAEVLAVNWEGTNNLLIKLL